jgi:hypothetical protein
MASDPTFVARPFGGRSADLEIDFAHPDRPALVTALLAACMPPHDDAHWWACSVGERHRALLALLRTTAAPSPAQPSTCPACGQRLEFELPIDALAAGAADDTPVDVAVGERRLRMRRPTGRDLQAWQAHARTPPTRAAMLQALLVEGELRPEDEDAAAQALAQADPLVDFAVQAACPHCGESAGHQVDLESMALATLADRQRAVLQEVHRLASRYGWTESQVLAVPPWRRAHYLRLTETA